MLRGMLGAMPRAGEPLTGRHVLAMMLGFFGIVTVVNAVFIYLAVSSFTGIETENAYVEGLAYNETLGAAEAQKALGWRVVLDHRPVGRDLREISVAFRDRSGRPIEGLTVVAELRRPTHEGADRNVALAPLGGGRYGVELDLPLDGQWDARVEATARGGERYILEQRLWLK